MKMHNLLHLAILTSLISCHGEPANDSEPWNKQLGKLPPDKEKAMVYACKYNSYEYQYNPSSAPWDWFYALTVDNMGVSPKENDQMNQYGSWENGPRLEATGFFRTQKFNGRWVIVDPAGRIHIDSGALTITPGGGEDNKRYFSQKFKNDKETWIFETMDSLSKYGFNGSGAWGNEELIQFYNDFSADRKCTYCPIMNPMSDYGYELGIATHKPGNTGYEGNCIPVFNPGFKEYCEKTIPEFVKKYRNDPNVLGYFSDNEMPLRMSNLESYLKMDQNEYGYRAAKAWMERNGYTTITDEVRLQFVGYVAETYYRIVRDVLKAADPNHLYLGSRLAGTSKTYEFVYKAAAKYCDIVSINYYGQWEVVSRDTSRWEKWADAPYMITEFYTKAEDSGLANTSGDGWIVKDQKSRGLHYENFIIGLLRTGQCVGWCWCKYLDNDPTALNAEPSNRDANKGIFDNKYEPYRELVESMTRVNNVRYSILSQYWQYSK